MVIYQFNGWFNGDLPNLMGDLMVIYQFNGWFNGDLPINDLMVI